jgi:replicative DNA helicase
MSLANESFRLERALINSIIFSIEPPIEIFDVISEEDFLRPGYRVIFAAIKNLAAKGMDIEKTLLRQEILVSGAGNQTDWEDALRDFDHFDLDSAPENILDHAMMIREKAQLRRYYMAGKKLMELAVKQEKGPDEIKSWLDSENHAIGCGLRSSEDFSLTDCLKDEILRLQEILDQNGVTGISSGYDNLDQVTAGFQRGELTVIAARPAMGKTALALNMALNAAQSGKKVYFMSLEMSRSQLTQRLLAISSEIPATSIKKAMLRDDQYETMGQVIAENLTTLTMTIADVPGADIAKIKMLARKMKNQDMVDIIFLDYLQLINGSAKNRNESREQTVSKVSATLKEIARELDIPVVALSQLNRRVEENSDKRPTLGSLRESGAIEQDADVVMLLYRDDYYNKDDSEYPGVLEIDVAKNRTGNTDVVQLKFIKELTKFQVIQEESG